MDRAELCNTWDYLYHYTSPVNAERIRRHARLDSAKALFATATEFDASQIEEAEKFLNTPRAEPVTLRLSDEEAVEFTDQAALTASFGTEDGTTPEDYIELLNSRIFFFPGDVGGPSPKAERFVSKHSGKVRLRFSTEALLEANWREGRKPWVSTVNSGSVGTGGAKVPRGPGIWKRLFLFKGRAREIYEVTFDTSVTLPPEA